MKRLIFALGLMMLAIGCVGGGNNADDGKLKETSAPYKVGDIYFEDGVLGVVFETKSGGMHGKIVSVDFEFMQWCDDEVCYNDTNAQNKYDGKINTIELMKLYNADMYYAAWWCANYGYGWYLPAKGELDNIYKNRSVINCTLSNYGFAPLNADMSLHWSSTENNKPQYNDTRVNVWGVNMSNGDSMAYYKHQILTVRAVYAF